MALRGNRRHGRVAAVALLAAVHLASSGVAAAGELEIDPAKVSPDLYTVLLENEHVRVVRYRIEPGQRDGWHTHPAKLMYTVEGGTLRVHLPDGSSFLAEETAGTATWMGPVGRHSGENVGRSPVQIVFVEVKAATGGH